MKAYLPHFWTGLLALLILATVGITFLGEQTTTSFSGKHVENGWPLVYGNRISWILPLLELESVNRRRGRGIAFTEMPDLIAFLESLTGGTQDHPARNAVGPTTRHWLEYPNGCRGMALAVLLRFST